MAVYAVVALGGYGVSQLSTMTPGFAWSHRFTRFRLPS
jgi:hypothetical protein